MGAVDRPRLPLVAVAVLVLGALCALSGCGGPADSPEVQAMREYQRGLTLQEEGKVTLAGEAYSNALRLNPRHANAYVARGYIRYVHENYRRAMADLNRAIALDPDIAQAYSYRGMVYVAADELENAFLSFTKAVQLDPELTEAYYGRAQLNYGNGNIEAAIDDMTSVIELGTAAPKNLLERAQLYVLAGDPENAASDLEHLLSVTRDDSWVLPAKELLSQLGGVGTP